MIRLQQMLPDRLLSHQWSTPCCTPCIGNFTRMETHVGYHGRKTSSYGSKKIAKFFGCVTWLIKIVFAK